MAAARPQPGSVEERTQPDLLTAEDKRIRGVIPYGTESRDLGGFREFIHPGALNATKFDDLVVTVDHVGLPLGRFPGTLEIEDRADGLHWSVKPPASRQDIVEAVERGDLKAGSWRMVVGRDEWRGNVRYIHQIDVLRDVSIATRPAYEDAVVEYRSQPNPGFAQEDTMGTQPEKTETTIEQPDDESRGLEIRDTGSLRVEERAERPLIHNLADLYGQRGFFENRIAQITWDEYRSFTWSAGTTLVDLNPVRREGVPLGYNTRWLYPVVPTTAVDAATTSVQYLRQSDRTLAGTAVIRALDATTTKPETSSTVEYQTLQLSQIATVCTGVPRIHAAQPMFQSIVEQDLRLSINDGLDEVVRRGVALAGTIAKGSDDVLTVVRKAMTNVGTAGYNADVLAIDPAGAQALDLLQSSGSEKFYLWGPGRAAPTGPFGLTLRVSKAAGTAVLDSSSFGRLYASPVELRSFEADAGVSNRQNLRMELNAGFATERLPAAIRIT
jgi:HK97 family phage prohead protease